MTMRNEWHCREHRPGHESLYYAVIDLKGRLLSMNAAMSKEFGIGSPNRVTSFQMLLQEKDVQNFNNLLQAKDQGTATEVPASLYTFSGTDRTPIKWSFFHLISGVTPNGTILCAGNTNQLADCAEDIAIIKEEQQEDVTISPSQM